MQEIRQLRQEVAALKAETAELKLSNQLLQNDLKAAKVFTTLQRVDDLWSWVDDQQKALDRLQGRKEPGNVTDGRLKRTDSILVKRRNEPVSYSEMGKLQEWSKETRRQNMTHLGHLYEQFSDRYEVRESKLGGKTVRLVPLYYKHITIGGVKQ